MKPVIGIIKISNIIYHLCAEAEYICALKSCGANVRFVKNSDEALGCDGILFTGGSDITPSFYGEKKDPRCGNTNPKRDRLEKEIFGVFFVVGDGDMFAPQTRYIFASLKCDIT